VARARVEIDLTAPGAAERYSRDLPRGGLVVPGVTLEMAEECDVAFLVGEDEPVLAAARVVWPGEGNGVGIELVDLPPDRRARLMAACEAAPAADPAEDHAGEDDGTDDDESRAVPTNVYDRLRGLSMAQAVKASREGDMTERIALERIYGKTVWEPLLRNPRITVPEVARLARRGTMPRVLLEVIVSNAAWVGVPEVRRALLSNPRLGAEMYPRVLRHLSKQELKLATTQIAYPNAVREAARRLIKSQVGEK
jgi:hypothetical protein